MSVTTTSNGASAEPAGSISEAEDVKMFQAARRAGRRNALGDLGDQLAQGDRAKSFSYRRMSSWILPSFLVDPSASSSDVDKIAPRLQSMSIKH